MKTLGIYVLFVGKYINNFNRFITSIDKLNSNYKITLNIITDKIDYSKKLISQYRNININIFYTDNLTSKIINICKYNIINKYFDETFDYYLLCDSNIEILSLDNLDQNKLNMNNIYKEKFIFGSLQNIRYFLDYITNKVNWALLFRNINDDIFYIDDFINSDYFKNNNLEINYIDNKNFNVFIRKKTLGIYYIATGKYNNGFLGFMKNIEYFYPDCDKTIILLSDNLSEYDGKIFNGCKIEYHEICGNSWPIVTLYKMHYILKYKGDYDYCCYCNADVVFNKDFKKYENIDLTRFTASKHNWMNDNFQALPLKDDNPNSTSYIGDHIYDYANGCFFIGESTVFYRMCEDVNNMLDIDLKNNIIPRWHDETYLNKWCFTHKDLAQTNIRLIFPCNPNEEGPCYLDYDAVKKPKFGE